MWQPAHVNVTFVTNRPRLAAAPGRRSGRSSVRGMPYSQRNRRSCWHWHAPGAGARAGHASDEYGGPHLQTEVGAGAGSIGQHRRRGDHRQPTQLRAGRRRAGGLRNMQPQSGTPDIPVSPDQPHTPPVEDPPDNPDVQPPNLRVREPEPPGPKRSRRRVATAYRLAVPSSRLEEASCAEARVPYASQPEAEWPAWAAPVAVAQLELVERGARAQGRASQPVPA